MTLIVAVQFQDGMVLSTDRRVIVGGWMKRDTENKITRITDAVGVGAAGITGAIDDILDQAKNQVGSRSPTFDDVVDMISDMNFQWLQENKLKLGEGQGGATFIVASSEAITRIFDTGYREKARGYAVDGSGRGFGEYILSRDFRENLTEAEAMKLAVNTILETSRMDPNVGDEVSMLVFKKGAGCREIALKELVGLKSQLTSGAAMKVVLG